MNIKKVLFAVLGLCLMLLFAGQVRADDCSGALPVGSATGCGAVINVTGASGGVATAFSVTNTGNGNPYDNVEDTLVGLDNNTGATLNSITLTATDNTFGGLANFDGDGPCAYNTSDCFGTTGYEGPNMTFSNIVCNNAGCDSVTVNFTGGLAAGQSAWFALEGTPATLTGGGGIGGATPEPGSLMLLGTGLLGLGLLVRRSL